MMAGFWVRGIASCPLNDRTMLPTLRAAKSMGQAGFARSGISTSFPGLTTAARVHPSPCGGERNQTRSATSCNLTRPGPIGVCSSSAGSSSSVGTPDSVGAPLLADFARSGSSDSSPSPEASRNRCQASRYSSLLAKYLRVPRKKARPKPCPFQSVLIRLIRGCEVQSLTPSINARFATGTGGAAGGCVRACLPGSARPLPVCAPSRPSARRAS